MKHRKWSICAALTVIGLLAGGFSTAEPANDFQSSIQALEWRNIGPFNGGRGTSVVGHPTDPQVFWFGHSSGGLWKTDDAGAYWTPVGEGQFRYASVGAIALHEKAPNIMYVGLGEPQLRQSVSWGDGMYKSVDGGETGSPWRTGCWADYGECRQGTQPIHLGHALSLCLRDPRGPASGPQTICQAG